MSHPFLSADIPDLVRKLKTEEKISLLGAPNWWNTTAIERVGIPSIRMSDGPNVTRLPNHLFQPTYPLQGVRGSSHFVPTPAQCLPVSSP